MDFLKRFFDGDSDEILFFVLVFLFIFNGNLFGKNRECEEENDKGSVLFFIVLFLLLFLNNDNIL